MHRESGRTSRRHGFSLVELILALVLGAILMSAVLRLFITQNSGLTQQREMADTWVSLRTGLEVLAYDLRQASASGGDLSRIAADSFTVRARRGSGVVCARRGNNPWYSVAAASGDFSFATDDSVQVATVQAMPGWRNVRVASIVAPDTACVWPGSAAPTVGVRLTVTSAADTALVTVGSVMFSFRSTTYGVTTTSDGRHWLARRQPGSAAWEIITGPLRSDGLQLAYYTAAGAVATVPSTVAAVQVTLRAESFGRTRGGQFMQDTVTMRISLRN
jgi:prepilin-type N-terminal cleavage/methylation domain-containing protein